MKIPRLKKFIIPAVIVAAVIILIITLGTCSHKKTYKLSGDIKDGREMTLRLLIYSPGGVRSEVIATRSGHFEFTGNATESGKPIFIEIYTHDYKLVGLAAVEKESDISMTISPDGMKGFRTTPQNEHDPKDFSSVLDDWIRSVDEINNESIARFIDSHRSNPAAYAVLINLYDASKDPAGALKLLNSLGEDATPGYYNNGFDTLLGVEATKISSIEKAELLCSADTMFAFNPKDYNKVFIAFTVEDNYRTDSLAPALQELAADAKRKDLLILEHNLSSDTTTWRRALRNDEKKINKKIEDAEKEKEPKKNQGSSKVKTKETPKEKIKWTSVWTGPGVGAPFVKNFGITSLPFYIVADSTASILYAGPSLQTARDSLLLNTTKNP